MLTPSPEDLELVTRLIVIGAFSLPRSPYVRCCWWCNEHRTRRWCSQNRQKLQDSI